MATFREMVYMVLGLLKERSDDAYYTEEHVLFLVSRMRSVLLERKYRGSRNTAFVPMSSENMQTLCLDLEAADFSGRCNGAWLKSVQKIPDMLMTDILYANTISDMLPTQVTFVDERRIPYVGHNPWLSNIMYCARSKDGHLYFRSGNPQFMFLEKVITTGVFSDPEKASALECTVGGDSIECDVLDRRFPLEDSLIPQCIELVVQELTGARYAPEDKINDAKDNLGEVKVTQPTASATQKAKTDETGA